MDRTRLQELERAIGGLADVVAVISSGDEPVELQVFTASGSDQREVRAGVRQVLGRSSVTARDVRVLVFELAEDAAVGVAGDPYVVEPVATDGRGRVRIGRVVLASEDRHSAVTVNLDGPSRDGEGTAEAATTPHNLHVTAEATLDALATLTGYGVSARVEAAGLVALGGRQAVCVVVDVAGTGEVVGACLVGETPVHEAAVRATLDAVNRLVELPEAVRTA